MSYPLVRASLRRAVNTQVVGIDMHAALRLASCDYYLAGPALLTDRVGDVRAPACQLTL